MKALFTFILAAALALAFPLRAGTMLHPLWPLPLKGGNDAGISFIINPTGTYCYKAQAMKVKLNNFSDEELDSVEIGWSLNNKVQPVYYWAGKLSTQSITLVTLGTFTFPVGKNTIKVWSSMPNGTIDSIPQNDTSVIVINVSPLPKAYTGNDTSICYGQYCTLGDSQYTKGHTYKWTNASQFVLSVYNNLQAGPASNSTYYLTETIISTGCSHSDSVRVKVNPLPVAKTGGDKSICQGSSIRLGDSAVTGNTYIWKKENYGLISKSSSVVVSPDKTTQYFLTATNTATGCSYSDSALITTIDLPNALVGSNKSICQGDIATLGADSVTGNTYQWSSNPPGFSANTSKITVKPDAGTVYFLTETIKASGCSTIKKVSVTINSPADASWSYVQKGNTVTFIAHDSSLNYSAYTWNLGDNAWAHGQRINHYYVNKSKYKVSLTVVGNFGCKNATDSTINLNAADVAEQKASAAQVSIYPNPFSNSTRLYYQLQQSANVSLCLYDMNGRQINPIYQGTQGAGGYHFDINAAKLGLKAGIYLIKLSIDDVLISRNIVKME